MEYEEESSEYEEGTTVGKPHLPLSQRVPSGVTASSGYHLSHPL